MSQPFNITISVPSGNPDQLRVIEKSNRLGRALVFNRSELKQVAKERQELGYTGVYLLVNSSADSLAKIYVGEGESVLERLRSHDSKKDFWEWAVVFVHRDNSLHKGHIQHAEASLVALAAANKRCLLDNDVAPKKPSLPESALFEAEDFLKDIYQTLPLLGINAFESAAVAKPEERGEPLYITTKGITAQGYTQAGKLVVLQGSEAVLEDANSISNSFSSWRSNLAQQGVLVMVEGRLVFTQDYTFESPSTAAAVVMGRNANGRTEWRTLDRTTLKELQEAE